MVALSGAPLDAPLEAPPAAPLAAAAMDSAPLSAATCEIKRKTTWLTLQGLLLATFLVSAALRLMQGPLQATAPPHAATAASTPPMVTATTGAAGRLKRPSLFTRLLLALTSAPSPPSPFPPHARSGQGAEYTSCSAGSDCSDCSSRGGSCANTCSYSSDGDCDDGYEIAFPTLVPRRELVPELEWT